MMSGFCHFFCLKFQEQLNRIISMNCDDNLNTELLTLQYAYWLHHVSTAHIGLSHTRFPTKKKQVSVHTQVF